MRLSPVRRQCAGTLRLGVLARALSAALGLVLPQRASWIGSSIVKWIMLPGVPVNRSAGSSVRTDMSERHRVGRSEWSVYTRAWWKFVIAGPVIIATVIIGAALGVDAWFAGFTSVVLAFLLIAVGCLLALAQLAVRRRSVARGSAEHWWWRSRGRFWH